MQKIYSWNNTYLEEDAENDEADADADKEADKEYLLAARTILQKLAWMSSMQIEIDIIFILDDCPPSVAHMWYRFLRNFIFVQDNCCLC